MSGISFEKRKLDMTKKTAPSEGVGVRLDKKESGLITATLKWRSGMGAGKSDLDLFGWSVGTGTSGGRKGGIMSRLAKKDPNLAEVIYHKRLGALNEPPYVQHSGDSRTPGSEVMRVGNLHMLDYVLFGVYQAFGNGAGSLRSFDAHVVVTDTEGNEVTVRLDQSHPNRYWAAIALIDFTHPQGYAVKLVEDYSKPGTEKSPVLYADGRFEMNVGPTYLLK